MKYNFNFFKKECIKNIIKYGKIKSNYKRLKKVFFFLNCYLIKYFNKNIKTYLVKLYYKKGDNTLLGEFGVLFFYKKKFLK
ncbi:hypothetical protein [Candidatus Carsonella ruddii]|uniref:Ribosomal protein L17 n=1 Tax=Candidatus Carsonella ruddii HC isolate Thao2000 TaxID=1202538 RepID=J3VPZ9_CARRU|nr:hypothetical protein [Candidatus Carsonella ruddii]AFP84001.1 ribosomal protein L17 [Candidatus Carsonella ruddii HC isolate Thao2000]